MKPRQLLERLAELNPELTWTRGKKSHYKIYLGGKLIAILPYTFAREGMAVNTKAQLRRHGVMIP